MKIEFRDIRREFFEKAFDYSSDKTIAKAYLDGMFDAFNIITECIDITYKEEPKGEAGLARDVKKCTIYDSSVLSAVEYNPNLRAMKIKFTSGSVYIYRDIEEELYMELIRSDYKGQYFNKYIKPKYKGIRLDKEEEENNVST